MKTLPSFRGTGSRKTGVARVRLVPGEGTVVVNGKPLEEYFGRDGYSDLAVQPFLVTSTVRRFNAMVKVQGGGGGPARRDPPRDLAGAPSGGSRAPRGPAEGGAAHARSACQGAEEAGPE